MFSFNVTDLKALGYYTLIDNQLIEVFLVKEEMDFF